MNPERIKSSVKILIATFGGAVAGWFAHGGWVTQEQMLSLLNSEAFVGLLTSMAAWGWSMWDRSKARMVAAVNAMPEVAAVLTKPTADGVRLANALPDVPTVVPAGTRQAADLARAS